MESDGGSDMGTVAECPHGMGDPAWCSTCKHGPTKPEPVTVERVFTANYDGECGGCDLPIHVGERIARLSNDRYVHEGCT